MNVLGQTIRQPMRLITNSAREILVYCPANMTINLYIRAFGMRELT